MSKRRAGWGSRSHRRVRLALVAALGISLPLRAIAQSLPPPAEVVPPEPPHEVPPPEVSPPEAPPPEAALPETPSSPAVVESPPPPPPPGNPPAPVAAPGATPPVPPSEPLAGFSDGTPFLRSPDGGFVVFPGGRLQTDGYFFRSKDKTPNETILLRSARLELSGWIGGFVFFSITGEFAAAPPAAAAPVAPANLITNDDYVAIAPWKNLAILQVGQFDAPFTLENRTSSKYLDFMERSITVRAFGIPDNKEMGAMLHGYNDDRNFHYSIGAFNGDGQNFKNADSHFDWMGRAWIAPLSFVGSGPLHDVEIGASFWTGDRGNTLTPSAQTTQGGFTFFNTAAFTATPTGATAAESVQLRQVGRLNAFAGELNAPLAHRYGVRGELVWKHSPLSEESIAASGVGTILGGAELRGYSMYGEAWVWLLGDDRIIGDQQGLGAFPRYQRFGVKPVQDGVMVAVRYEHLDEDLTEYSNTSALKLGNKSLGKTKVDSAELGVNYWHSKRFRATANYVLNHIGGTAPFVTNPMTLPSAYEQELLFRLGIAL
jgi:phosphate-selective porin